MSEHASEQLRLIQSDYTQFVTKLYSWAMNNPEFEGRIQGLYSEALQSVWLPFPNHLDTLISQDLEGKPYTLAAVSVAKDHILFVGNLHDTQQEMNVLISRTADVRIEVLSDVTSSYSEDQEFTHDGSFEVFRQAVGLLKQIPLDTFTPED